MSPAVIMLFLAPLLLFSKLLFLMSGPLFLMKMLLNLSSLMDVNLMMNMMINSPGWTTKLFQVMNQPLFHCSKSVDSKFQRHLECSERQGVGQKIIIPDQHHLWKIIGSLPLTQKLLKINWIVSAMNN